MTKEVIIEKINDFLIDEFEVESDDISPEANLKNTLELDSLDFVDLVVAVEANLKDTLGLDSLDYVDLVVTIEANFGVKLVGEDFVNVTTLQDFYNLIERKLS